MKRGDILALGVLVVGTAGKYFGVAGCSFIMVVGLFGCVVAFLFGDE